MLLIAASTSPLMATCHRARCQPECLAAGRVAVHRATAVGSAKLRSSSRHRSLISAVQRARRCGGRWQYCTLRRTAASSGSFWSLSCDGAQGVCLSFAAPAAAFPSAAFNFASISVSRLCDRGACHSAQSGLKCAPVPESSSSGSIPLITVSGADKQGGEEDLQVDSRAFCRICLRLLLCQLCRLQRAATKVHESNTSCHDHLRHDAGHQPM